MAGSVQIGNNVILAGGSGIAGHIKVGDKVTVGGWTGVTKDLPSGGTFLGTPAIEIERMRKCYMIIQRLPEMRETVKDLKNKDKTTWKDKLEKWKRLGLIAGNGRFPILFAQSAKAKGCKRNSSCY